MVSIDFNFRGIFLTIPAVPEIGQQYIQQHRDALLENLKIEYAHGDVTLSALEILCRLILTITKATRSKARTAALEHLWQLLHSQHLKSRDIHEVIHSDINTNPLDGQRVLKLYSEARLEVVGEEFHSPSALFHAQTKGHARIFAIFGGQGNTSHYFDELHSLWTTYHPFISDLVQQAGRLLRSLAANPFASEHFSTHGVQVTQWLEKPASRPPTCYLLSAPISFPLIGLLQLSQVKAICMSLGMTPGGFLSHFEGMAGYSQGVVVAAAISNVQTWPDFEQAMVKALTILFWIGARSQEVFRKSHLSTDQVLKMKSDGHGSPSPMLSVGNVERRKLAAVIESTNALLPPDRRANIALLASVSNFVVSGPDATLVALIHALRNSTATTRFLPISIPCHSPLLDAAVPLIISDLRSIDLSADKSNPPSVYGSGPDDIRSGIGHNANLVPTLVEMITTRLVDWPAVSYGNTTHIIDFGPGATGGTGRITSENLIGSGVRVIVASGPYGLDEPSLGGLNEVFQTNHDVIKWTPHWERQLSPRVLRTPNHRVLLTKFSRLLKLPPVMVAGMTPTTTHPDFVAAIMRAGYHAEFACGGYSEPSKLRSALQELRDLIPLGRTITVNVIYASPKAIAWQIPLIKQLRAQGFPITGLTIGAGVPSPEVATEYITTLGLQHISFKPSSSEAIQSVIQIAISNPSFPVILQWTGGRGGGHHSAEDFHIPILQTYAKIRDCSNLILVAGSGFGCSADATPYFTGTWSLEHGKTSLMPFDGVLLGSRVMTCAETHTSPGAKAAIVAAQGVEDRAWRGTYDSSTGGVVSVRSEMGEPIHVIATRGAQLWSELDKTIFSLDKNKRLSVLRAKKEYIISRLNADFQRPWFGRLSSNAPCDTDDMTYAQVVERLLELVHINNQWVDPSYEKLVHSLVSRVVARLGTTEGKPIDLEQLMKHPTSMTKKLIRLAPEAKSTLVGPEDAHYFVQMCRGPGVKPVPFIPVLDESFETWFKKDSLWQSENLHTVIDQDAGRTFILHGPVAALHTGKINESVADVLDAVHRGILDHVMATGEQNPSLSESVVIQTSSYFRDWGMKLPKASSALLSGVEKEEFAWAAVLLGVDSIVVGPDLVTNPWKKLLSTTHEEHETSIRYRCETAGVSCVDMSRDGSQIHVLVTTDLTPSSQPISVMFKFEYRPHTAYAPIVEIMEGRNERLCNFYRRLWQSEGQEVIVQPCLSDNWDVENTVVIEWPQVKTFNRAIGYQTSARADAVTLDFASVASWSTISPLLLQQPRNILNLVHLSNSYAVPDRSAHLRVGDKFIVRARVAAIINQEAGLRIEIVCELRRPGQDTAAVRIRSCFLFRGERCEESTSFNSRDLGPYELKLSSNSDITVLESKSWFRLPDNGRLGDVTTTPSTLQFHLQQFEDCHGKQIWGAVYSKSDSCALTAVGKVNTTKGSDEARNVLSYLSRRGCDSSAKSALGSALPQEQGRVVHTSSFQAPESNTAYSCASGDFNPIHTSSLFAGIAGLPGTITHGMHCSAIVRSIIESDLCDQDGDRIRAYNVDFVSMVLPNALLEIEIEFITIKAGCSTYDFQVRDRTRSEKVLTGSVTIAQPQTTYVFTGQGSQEKGMGMDLYASSKPARSVWDRAESYFQSQFGLSILDIVRNNPKAVTVHFKGFRGRELRRNYRSMHHELPPTSPNGKARLLPMFPNIHEDSTSFTHTSSTGLLFATQFAQPALAIMEIAAYRDLQHSGVVDPESNFTGHSLGEYVALSCRTDVMSLECMLFFCFCRGMTMQSAVERDTEGRSAYSMVVVDPSRVAKTFDEISLRTVVTRIEAETGCFIELVNLNIRDKQYVCSGDLLALTILQKTCDWLHFQMSGADLRTIDDHLNRCPTFVRSSSCAVPEIQLERGRATIPLTGIDVPFHSRYLRPRLEAFRRVILDTLDTNQLLPEALIGKYIPNVTGVPLRIDREYFEQVWKATGSERIAEVLKEWQSWKTLDRGVSAMVRVVQGTVA